MNEAKIQKPISQNIMLRWLLAVILPYFIGLFIMVVCEQFQDTDILTVVPPATVTVTFLTLTFFPSYICFLFKSSQLQKVKNHIVWFSLSLVIQVPVLVFYVFAVTCSLFGRCL